MILAQRRFSGGLGLLLLLAGFAAPARAGLFSDSEARAKIASQQQEIDQLKKRNQELEGRIAKLEEAAKGSLDLYSQLEALKQDMAKLRGQIEVLSNANEMTAKRQKDFYLDLDTRLKRLEQASAGGATPVAGAPAAAPAATPGIPAAGSPPSGTLAGASPSPPVSAAIPPAAATPPPSPAALPPGTEIQAYETAFAQFRGGDYKGAIKAFQGFLRAYPQSSLAPSAQYWTGNAYYALRDYKSAIASQRKLISTYPNASKVPDAMLNIASSQLELNDLRGAKKTLQELVAKYPASDAADKAKRRLELLR